MTDERERRRDQAVSRGCGYIAGILALVLAAAFAARLGWALAGHVLGVE